MKIILLENPEIQLENEVTKIEDGFVLINLDEVIEIVISKKTGKAALALKNNKVYYLTIDDTINLLKSINDPQIIRPSSIGKIYKDMERLR